MKYTFLFASIINILLLTNSLHAQTQPVGTIEGEVIDATTQNPIIGSNIIVLNTALGATSDTNGKFIIKNVPIGSYTLQFRLIGYTPMTKTDIIVRPQRTTTVSVQLTEHIVENEQITITSDYFNQSNIHTMNSVGFNYEEIRRSPGSAGDISRVMMLLPSLAKISDQSNSLIVRGGSPIENGFYIDNIEIPTINHFPTQGTTGGPIGILNVDLIEKVDFHIGGFSPEYTDKLSSILDIQLREGNKTNFEGQLDFNITGFGGVIEGPLNEKSSYIISARRSYLQYLVKMFDVGTTVAPSYGDIQGKITYNISPNHKISLIAISADDHNTPNQKTAQENDMIYYGNQESYQNTIGLNWQALWEDDGYSRLSIGYQSSHYNENFYETITANQIFHNTTQESSINILNKNYFQISQKLFVEFGTEIKQYLNKYNTLYNKQINTFGTVHSANSVQQNITTPTIGTFAHCTFKPFPNITTTLGIRANRYFINNKTAISPRTTILYTLNETTTLRSSVGMYHQNLPLVLLVQNNNNKKLNLLTAVQYNLGFDKIVSEGAKLSIELYHKQYDNFPIDPSIPSIFLVDELFYHYGFFTNHEALTDKAKARASGMEISFQKKLLENFYGFISASYSKTEYKNADNIWRNRIFDNGIILSMEGGYKPNNEWEFSGRWIYAGGTPYTPFDRAQSQEKQYGILDGTQVNAVRYPSYHSLNIRCDKRFHFEHSNLVVYVSVWNLYNRKNIAGYIWDTKRNQEKALYQWNFLPIFGIEYEL